MSCSSKIPSLTAAMINALRGQLLSEGSITVLGKGRQTREGWSMAGVPKYRKRSIRTETGQTMGVADLLIIVPVTVLAILLLLNIGVSMYFKSKLGFIASQAATFAAAQVSASPSVDPTPKTKALVIALLKAMGLPFGTTSVGVTPFTAAGQKAVSVQIVDDFPLFGSATKVFPVKIKLQDNASAVVPDTSVPTMWFPIGGPVSTQFVLIPVLGVAPQGQPQPPGSFGLNLFQLPDVLEVVAQPSSSAGS